MDPHFYDDPQYAAYQTSYDPTGMDPYYAAAPPVFLRQPVRSFPSFQSFIFHFSSYPQLNYHLYTPTPLPNFASPTSDSHFIPPSSQLRQTLQKRSETIRGIAPIGILTSLIL